MKKESKYYSMNGQITKLGKSEKVCELKSEIIEFENAKNVLDNLCMKHIDRLPMLEKLDEYIKRKQNEINNILAKN